MPGGKGAVLTNDVMPLFTRYGCNQGACHGKGAGQNGFRLSLRGYAPERWTTTSPPTREFSGRRVSVVAPEESLLLRKADSASRRTRAESSSESAAGRIACCSHWILASAGMPRAAGGRPRGSSGI